MMFGIKSIFRFVRPGIADLTVIASNLDEAVRLFVAKMRLDVSLALILDGKGKYKVRFLKGAKCVFSCDLITKIEEWHIREVEF